MDKITLTIHDCMDVLDNNIMLGRDKANDGKVKQFIFNPWQEKYSIIHGNITTSLDSKDNFVEEIAEFIDTYNDL